MNQQWSRFSITFLTIITRQTFRKNSDAYFSKLKQVNPPVRISADLFKDTCSIFHSQLHSLFSFLLSTNFPHESPLHEIKIMQVRARVVILRCSACVEGEKKRPNSFLFFFASRKSTRTIEAFIYQCGLS